MYKHKIIVSLSAFFCKRFFVGHRRGHVGAQRFRRYVPARFIAQHHDPRLSQKVVAVGVVRRDVCFDFAFDRLKRFQYGKTDVLRRKKYFSIR